MEKAKTLTEAEWLSSDNPHELATSMPQLLTERRARLFACACCRRFLMPMLKDPRILQALGIAEEYADGKISQVELELASKNARKAQNAQRRKSLLWAYSAVAHVSDRWLGGNDLLLSADNIGEAIVADREPRIDPSKHKAAVAAERAPIAAVFREIMGNPFRTVKFEDKWKDGEVVKLAEFIYEAQRFDQIPQMEILLQHAGCTDSAILDHCRQPGPHVRGCWLIDGILDRH